MQLERTNSRLTKKSKSFKVNQKTSSLSQTSITTHTSNKKAKVSSKEHKNYKTEICKNFELNKNCRFGSQCCYAHGKEELRKKTVFKDHYKTKICKHFHTSGFCAYSSRCQYFHLTNERIYAEILESFVDKTVNRMKEYP